MSSSSTKPHAIASERSRHGEGGGDSPGSSVASLNALLRENAKGSSSHQNLSELESRESSSSKSKSKSSGKGSSGKGSSSSGKSGGKSSGKSSSSSKSGSG